MSLQRGPASCARCRSWRSFSGAVAVKGECRRYPPQVIQAHSTYDHNPKPEHWWPTTRAEEWCSEFVRKREEVE